MSATEHVLACDPGGRSGWASAKMGPDRFEFTGGGVLRDDLMPDAFASDQRVGVAFGVFKIKPRYDVLVYESWYPRRDASGRMDWIEGSPLASVQQIGALRWIARASNTKIVTQHPSDKSIAISTMPDVLRTLDRDSTEQHDKDARMHLWLYFWRNWFEGKAVQHVADVVIL